MNRKKSLPIETPKLRFDRTPEWRRLAQKVLIAKEKGMSEDAIALIVKTDPQTVMRILEDENEVSQYAKRTWDEKVPTIRKIISLSLAALNDTLMDISENADLRRVMLSKTSDLKQLTDVITELNTLLRLELGESTQNIAINKKHTYQETRVVLQELQKKDPVFGESYPTLPDITEGKNGE